MIKYFIGVLLICRLLGAQQVLLLDLEAQHGSLEKRIKTIEGEIDSLQHMVDHLKDKGKGEKEEARIFALSQKKARLALQLDSLNHEMAVISWELNQIYTRKIDSLRAEIRNSNETVHRDTLARKLIRLVYKRLIISPHIPALSYNPQRILQIDTYLKEDEKHREIAIDFLRRALREADSLFQLLVHKKRELEDFLSFRERVQNFVDDVENTDIFQTPILDGSEQDGKYKALQPLDEVYRETKDLKEGIILLNQLPVYGNFEPHEVINDERQVNLLIARYQDLEGLIELYRDYIKRKLEQVTQK